VSGKAHKTIGKIYCIVCFTVMANLKGGLLHNMSAD